VVASVTAIVDRAITKKSVDVGDIVVTAVPVVKLGKAAAALTDVAEVGHAVKQGQEVLHAGAATLNAGAAVAEAQHAAHNESAAPQSRSQQPKESLSPPTSNCRGTQPPESC
jgi:hypothetical protein